MYAYTVLDVIKVNGLMALHVCVCVYVCDVCVYSMNIVVCCDAPDVVSAARADWRETTTTTTTTSWGSARSCEEYWEDRR